MNACMIVFVCMLVVVLMWNDQQESLCASKIPKVTDVTESGPFVVGEKFLSEESLWGVWCVWLQNAISD